MKKILITLIILVVLSVTAFMFGWVQFSVPPGKYGVIHSKTHGIDLKPVHSGEFRWIWYKLIPTNVKIAVFSLEHNKYPINYKSTLPSGDTYAFFTGLTNVDFSWNFIGEIGFNLDPEMLVPLAVQHNLSSQDELNTYLQNIAQNIEALILRSLASIGSDSARLERFMSGNPDLELELTIKSNFPEIRDFNLVIHSARYPDFILYRQIRQNYETFLDRQSEYITSSFGKRAEHHIETQLRFEELERYGDLLTRYPILLDYMVLENEIAGNR
ncbi:MAG: hypothetical protein FWD22_05710 [Treponema sp.]|nr:hypothetical protein [Treponema sp.]